MFAVFKNRQQGLLVIALCLLGNLSTVGAALPYPILPPLFVGPVHHPVQDWLGLAPKLLLGLALAINPLGLLIGAAVLGPMSDRYGRRTTLISTALVAVVGHALCAWALVAGSFPWFALARFVTGLAEGNVAVARAMLADQIDDADRTRAFGWFNTALYLGWLFGPLLAGATLPLGLAVPFLIAAVALLATAVLTLRVLSREPAQPANSTAPTVRAAGAAELWRLAREGHSLNLLRHADIRRLFGLQLAFTLGQTAFYEFYPVWLVEVAACDAQGISWVTAALCLILAGCSVLAGRPDAAPVMRRIAQAAGLAGLCFGVLAVAGERLGTVAIIAAGLPIGFYNTLIQSEIARRFGDRYGQGAVMGLVSTVFCVSNIVAALFGSVLAVIDTRVILGTGALFTLSAAIGITRMERTERSASALRTPVTP